MNRIVGLNIIFVVLHLMMVYFAGIMYGIADIGPGVIHKIAPHYYQQLTLVIACFFAAIYFTLGFVFGRNVTWKLNLLSVIVLLILGTVGAVINLGVGMMWSYPVFPLGTFIPVPFEFAWIVLLVLFPPLLIWLGLQARSRYIRRSMTRAA